MEVTEIMNLAIPYIWIGIVILYKATKHITLDTFLLSLILISILIAVMK